ncbi:MAG: DUF952 domain-containing protein, partial [Chloroflexota bacterium]
MDDIFHICTRKAWDGARKIGSYKADSLVLEGFIHCSMLDQVLRVADSYYRAQKDLVLLVIDPGKLLPEVCWEPGSDKPDELFPHIFGPINLEAVRKVLDFKEEPDG